MTALAFKSGDELELQSDDGGDPVIVIVHCYWFDTKNDAHRIIARSKEDGGLHYVLRSRKDSAAFERQVADVAQAESVARAHLNGSRIALGVEAQLNLLAVAVLQLRGAL